MTQEEKQLLLKDLCARLPYGVKVKTPYNDATLIGLIKRKGFKKDEYYIDAITDKQTYPVRYIQSYLRPMSSMTEEEKVQLSQYACIGEDLNGEFIDEVQRKDCAAYIDWLNAHHFDYNGLIEKGLALKAPKYMYK